MLRGWYGSWMAVGLSLLAAPTVLAQLNSQDMQRISWREIGPSATGGRIIDVEVDPRKASRIYAAAASGGLWKSENNGTTWTALFQNEETMSIGDIALDPGNPDTVWVGTGEANNQRSSLWGDGIYRSDDGGKSFQNMGLRDTHHIGRIVVHPRDSRVVYVAALGRLYSANEERGLFKTTDGGKSWKKVLYVNPDVGVVDVAINPLNPEIVFAASYERRRRAWDFDGAGPGSAIYRSRDGGKSWTRLGGAQGLPEGEIGRIGLAVFPKNPNVVYATVSNQNRVFAEDSGEGAEPPVDADFGEESAWSDSPGGDAAESEQEPPPPVDDAVPQQDAAADSQDKPDPNDRPPHPPAPTPPPGEPAGEPPVEDAPQEPKSEETPPLTMTVLGVKFGVDDQGVFVAETNASAARAGVRSKDRVVSLGGRPVPNREVLQSLLSGLRDGDAWTVVVQRGDRQLTLTLSAPARQPREIGGEVYRSDDGGETWVKQNNRPVGGSPAYYYGRIYVDPHDHQRLYLLGVPLYSSSDGGKSWDANTARSVHVDHHALWINPQDTDHLLLGNDGGLHASYDRGKTWDHIYNLPLAQFYAIGVDMRNPYHVYGGLQDNGTYAGPSQGGGRGVGRFDWRRVGGGDGFYVQIDPEDPEIVFYESQFGALQRSIHGERRGIRPPQSDPDGPSDRYNWNSPILMSSHDSRIIYFGGNKLFKSFNRGDDWLTISPDLTTANPARIAGNVPYCTITTIAESPRNRDVLLVGTDDGNVQWTNDGGKSWTNMAARFPMRPAEWWVSRVVLSHHDENTAYVSFTGYREDDFRPFVFMTRDRGASWTSLAADLPLHGPVNVIQEDPQNPRVLYVGTDFGVFVSIDQGGSWLPLEKGLPRVAVHDLLVHPREHDLVIGTHGRGIFVFDATLFSETPSADSQDNAFLFPVKGLSETPRVDSGLAISGDRRYLAADPPRVAEVYFHLKDKAESLSLEVVNRGGDAVAKLDVKNEPGLQKATWNPRGGQGRGRFGGRGGRFGGRGAQSSTPPGTYTIVLRAGDEEHRREIVVE